MNPQLPMDVILFHPFAVPTPDVDHGAEYIENDPVYWNNQSWNVLDWDFEHNVFVLLGDEEWEIFESLQGRRFPELRAQILKALWEEE